MSADVMTTDGYHRWSAGSRPGDKVVYVRNRFHLQDPDALAVASEVSQDVENGRVLTFQRRVDEERYEYIAMRVEARDLERIHVAAGRLGQRTRFAALG